MTTRAITAADERPCIPFAGQEASFPAPTLRQKQARGVPPADRSVSPRNLGGLKLSMPSFPSFCSRAARTIGRPVSLRDWTYPSRIASHPAFTLIDNPSASATIFTLAARRIRSFVRQPVGLVKICRRRRPGSACDRYRPQPLRLPDGSHSRSCSWLYLTGANPLTFLLGLCINLLRCASQRLVSVLLLRQRFLKQRSHLLLPE